MKNKKTVLWIALIVAALLALMAAVLPVQTDSKRTPGLKFTLPKGGTGYSVEKGKVKTGAVVIPESYNNLPVTAIAKKAFSSSTITSVTISNSITDIGNNSFRNTSLTSVIIGNGITRIEINAFYECSSLASVTFQGTIASSGFTESAFNMLGDLCDKFYAEDPTNGTPTCFSKPSTPRCQTPKNR